MNKRYCHSTGSNEIEQLDLWGYEPTKKTETEYEIKSEGPMGRYEPVVTKSQKDAVRQIENHLDRNEEAVITVRKLKK